MKIKVLITGGTIDKVYDEQIGELVFDKTHLPDMFSRGRVSTNLSLEVLFLKDSLDIFDADRQLVLNKCLQCSENHILISHGTDTMVETARLLGEHIKDKVIVLFGAMVPYSVNHSDALFNLGFAMQAVQVQKNGVYIAMNGQIFDFNKVKKDKELGVFQSQ